MRLVALFLLMLGAALGATPSIAAPPPSGGGGRPAYGGGHWGGGHPHGGGGPYRPGYGGWGHGYGGWGYGYPGYGFTLGLGYGAGWALTGGYPWYYWGAPVYPGYYYPYGYGVTTMPALSVNEDLVYVQRPPIDVASPPAQQPGSGYWYYCTEPAGYYPYVQQCTRPWIAVQPQAATPAR